MLAVIGDYILHRLDVIVEQAALLCKTVATIWTEWGEGGRVVRNVVKRQVLFTGVEAVKIITITAVMLGVATIVELITEVPRLSGESYIGPVLVAVVVRELGPLLTAFIIIGRSGTAIATEIGNMVFNHEVAAVDAMGIDPLRFIVLPRLIGVTTATVGLGFLFVMVALAGGYAFARVLIHYPFVVYLADLRESLGPWDVGLCFIKCLVFGVIIATICCYRGFSVKISSHEVPQVTIKAVVGCIYACFIVNIIITGLFYL